VPGAATNTMTVPVTSAIFDATTDTVTILVSDFPSTTTASTTWFILPHGIGSLQTTETTSKYRVRRAGTWKNFGVYISAARAQATTVKSRKAGADGNISVSCTGSTTGWFEDTTHSDTLSVGDDIDISVTTGTGADTLTIRTIKSEFISTA